MADQPVSMDVLGLTAQIVAAHVSHNAVPPTHLPALIKDVYRTLSGMGREPEPVVQNRPVPAVPVRKSIFPDYLVCLEDGKKLKMLRRHLNTSYDMTPEQYREKWGLPADYPMVAPSYAKHRSSLAKQIGLGTKPRAK
jgi:predicted transcriptional regulator